MEAIILAGGFGTRLSHIVFDVPKPMAPVNGRPFLEYIFDYLLQNKVKHVVLAIGYKGEVIQNHFGDSYQGIEITYSKEDKPLGTGGAIKKAFNCCKDRDVFVINGDTYFNVDLIGMMDFHKSKNSMLTVAVKLMNNFDRYGSVVINNDKILKFEEKKKTLEGKINGGIYLVNRSILNSILETSFSFEKRVLEDAGYDIFAYNSDGYFIDIGVPEDYEKAQKDFFEM
jgi:D-glycero-alpha-D-manno-heptose 1-phosphate guanylyltransferase